VTLVPLSRVILSVDAKDPLALEYGRADSASTILDADLTD